MSMVPRLFSVFALAAVLHLPVTGFAQQTVQIVQSSAGPIAKQGAAQAQKDFAQGKWDKTNVGRYGAQPVVTQR